MESLKNINMKKLRPVLDFISQTLGCGVCLLSKKSRNIVYSTGEREFCEKYLCTKGKTTIDYINNIEKITDSEIPKPFKCSYGFTTVPFAIKINNVIYAWIILGPIFLSSNEKNDYIDNLKNDEHSIEINSQISRIPVISYESLINKSEILYPVVAVITELIYEKSVLKEKKEDIENSYKKLKITENSLEETLNELETIFENSQVGIMLLRGGRIFAKGNQRLADILGWESPEEMKNISMRELHLSEKKFIEYGEKYFDALAHGEKIHIEYQLAKKDGSPVWCMLSGKAVDRKQPADLNKGVIWIIDDISKQKELESSLKLIATIDSLTGLYNRGKFDTLFNNEIQRATRYHSTFSFLLIDLDNFKSINDTYGHSAGDTVLKQFSKILKRTIREIDIPSRVGGEEFTIILPDTEKHNALLAAERIREFIAASETEFESFHLKYTVSIGIVEFRKGLSSEALYSMADKALYRAKSTGKNRVCLYDEEIDL